MSGAQSGYAVSVNNQMDVPERTVSLEGSSYTIDTLAVVDHGSQIRLSTSGPAEESYRMYIHAVDAGERKVYDTQLVEPDDDATISYAASTFEPGSYVVSLYADGTYYDPQPLLVPAYEAELSAPARTAASGTVEATVSLTALAGSESVDSVEVVLSGHGVSTRVTATQESDEYVASVPVDKLSPAEYQLHAVVYSPEAAPGSTNEVIGVSEAGTLTVEEATTATATPAETVTATATPTSTATATPTSTATPTPTATQTTTTSGTPTPTPTPTPTSSDGELDSPGGGDEPVSPTATPTPMTATTTATGTPTATATTNASPTATPTETAESTPTPPVPTATSAGPATSANPTTRPTNPGETTGRSNGIITPGGPTTTTSSPNSGGAGQSPALFFVVAAGLIVVLVRRQ